MYMSPIKSLRHHSQVEGVSNDVRVLQQMLHQKHEQLNLAKEVVHQLTHQAQRQSLAIHDLQSRLIDSECKVDALESEVRSDQHRVNHLAEHHHQSLQQNVALTERVKDAKDQISDQRLTVEMLRRSMHQQEVQNQMAMDLQIADSLKLKADLAALQSERTLLIEEKRRIDQQRLVTERRNKTLESSMAQMAADRVTLNDRVDEMSQRVLDCGAEIERQNEEHQALRLENEELLDRVSKMERDQEEDEELKALLDRCVQVDLSEEMDKIKIEERALPEMDSVTMTPRRVTPRGVELVTPRRLTSPGCGTAEYDCLEEEISFILQFDDHEEYLTHSAERNLSREEHAEADGDREAIKTKGDLLAKLVKEGIEREEELRKWKGSGLKKKSIWEIVASWI